MSWLRYIELKNWIAPGEQSNFALDNGLETPQLTATNTVQLTLTPEEFIVFLSAIEQGSEVIYPDRKHELTDLFIQGLQ